MNKTKKKGLLVLTGRILDRLQEAIDNNTSNTKHLQALSFGADPFNNSVFTIIARASSRYLKQRIDLVLEAKVSEAIDLPPEDDGSKNAEELFNPATTTPYLSILIAIDEKVKLKFYDKPNQPTLTYPLEGTTLSKQSWQRFEEEVLTRIKEADVETICSVKENTKGTVQQKQ